MPGNPHVRFDEGRVGRHLGARPLSYSTVSAVESLCRYGRIGGGGSETTGPK